MRLIEVPVVNGIVNVTYLALFVKKKNKINKSLGKKKNKSGKLPKRQISTCLLTSLVPSDVFKAQTEPSFYSRHFALEEQETPV